MMRKNGAAMAALAEAFPLTLPIFAGFWLIAVADGFYMNTLGCSDRRSLRRPYFL